MRVKLAQGYSTPDSSVPERDTGAGKRCYAMPAPNGSIRAKSKFVKTMAKEKGEGNVHS